MDFGVVNLMLGFLFPLAAFDGTNSGWDEFPRFVNPDGVDTTSVSGFGLIFCLVSCLSDKDDFVC